MSLRSHLLFERDNANLGREKINAELTVQLSHFSDTENRKLLIWRSRAWYIFPLINGFCTVLKSFESIPSIFEMLGKLRVIRKSLMKNWESSEVFGLVNSWEVWPLTTIFGVPRVFLAVSRVFWGIMGCSRGVPGLFRAVPRCSGDVTGCSGGVPGCSRVFRGVAGCSVFYKHPLKTTKIRLLWILNLAHFFQEKVSLPGKHRVIWNSEFLKEEMPFLNQV